MPIVWRLRRCLVIDDFTAFRKSVKRMIESFGVREVDDVGTGEEAIRLCERKKYDIIVCDYNLGDGLRDGQQVLEELRHRQLILPSCVFAMITAENTMAMVMGALEYQPDVYLIKPFVPEVLKRRLESCVEMKADLEEIEKAIRAKNHLLAIQLCDQKLESDPPNAMEIYRLKGDLCINVGNYEEARSLFQQVLSIRAVPWAQLGLGKAAFLLGQHEEAEKIFQNLIARNSTFMEAYDWLAKVHAKKGELRQAQTVLKRATEISPKAILRQKALGELSLLNQDTVCAEEAYKAAVNLGRHSCFKSASDHVGLAKVYVQTGMPERALEVTKQARQEFSGQADARVQVAVMDGYIYQAMDNDGAARQAIREAADLMGPAVSKSLPTKATLEIAKAFLVFGDTERGLKLAQDIVQNNHEDQGVIIGVQRLFDEAKLGDVGRKMIESATREIVELNNKGVDLVEGGRLEESIDLFEKAAAKLPGNKIINANAAHARLLYMKKKGITHEGLKKARDYLEKVRAQDPSYKKYQDLLPLYHELAKKTGSPDI